MRYVKQFLAVVSFNPPSAHSRWCYHPHLEELRLRQVKGSSQGRVASGGPGISRVPDAELSQDG